MRIDSSGNVGIGVSSPGHKLDVYLSGRLNQLGQGGHGLLVGPGSNTGGFTYMSTGDIEISTAQTTKDIVFSDAVGGNERMRLTGDTGRLGIGVSSPVTTLDMFRDSIRIRKNASNLAKLEFQASSTRIEYSDQSGNLEFYTNSSRYRAFCWISGWL